MELYLRVRLAVSEGMKKRQTAKHFNISRDSVAKMAAYSTRPAISGDHQSGGRSWMRSFRRSSNDSMNI